MKSYWIGFIKQRGCGDFLYLCWRKLTSFFVKFKFANCDDLMLCGAYQINGYKSISIGKLSAGERFRMEAISYSSSQTFTPEIVIGSNVSFGCDVHIGCISKLTIGNNVLCGSHVVILDHDHGCYAGLNNRHSAPGEPPANRILASAPIAIADNVHIGEYVVILKGIEIGLGSVIGAGSVVTRSIPANCLAVGNPAKIIKQFDFSKKQWINISNKLNEDIK
ncbi:MAG: acyltransferase [Methylococcaceae bacterium]